MYFFVENEMKIWGVKFKMAGWVAESVFYVLLPQSKRTKKIQNSKNGLNLTQG